MKENTYACKDDEEKSNAKECDNYNISKVNTRNLSMLINVLALKSNEKQKLNDNKYKEKLHLFWCTPSRKSKRNFLKSKDIITVINENDVDTIKIIKLLSNYQAKKSDDNNLKNCNSNNI